MLLIDTLNSKQVPRPPIWVMRQAGRYLPEYQATRAKAGSFFTLCDTPELAKEVTLQPIERFNLDAAIIFSDILVIPRALGRKVEFIESQGPKLDKLTDPAEVDALETDQNIILKRTQPTIDAISLTRAELDPSKALIGFCGAPWTLALYMLDASPAKGGHNARKWHYQHPQAFSVLIEKIINASITYLDAQIKAGANAIQIFDSWAGQAPDHLFDELITNPILKICHAIKAKHPQIPITVFARSIQEHRLIELSEKAKKGAVFNGLGLDETVNLSWANKHLQPNVCIQGNLDPAVLMTDASIIEHEVERILSELSPTKNFIFNLGHGITPQASPQNMASLVKAVQSYKA